MNSWEGELLDPAVALDAVRGIIAVDGENFSGRTSWLRDAAAGCGPYRSAYVGPDIANTLSGLAQSVATELQLMAGLPSEGIEILQALNLHYLLSRHPLDLSGGEQAIVCILGALALRRRRLCVDCSMEQIAPPLKRLLLCSMRQAMTEQDAVFVADNALADFDLRQFNAALPLRSDLPGVAFNMNLLHRPEFDQLCPAAPQSLLVERACFSYDKTPLLQEVSLTLSPGRVYWIDGPNGAGKTTLAKLLCGILRPTSGRIMAEDGKWTWQEPGALVAYHCQNPDMQLFSRTVREELSSRDIPDAVVSLIALLFGFEPTFLSEHPQELSFVLRKRVALAAAIARRRPWLLLDEPTLGQDQAATFSIVKIVEALAARGVGIIVISHSSSLRQHLPGQYLHLRDGRATAA